MTTTVYYVACSLDGFIADIGAVIMGAETYEFILNDPAEWSYTMPAWVLSHRELPGVDGADIRFTQADGPGDIAALHAAAALAAGEKNVWVIGGGNVASQFADAGLLDEVRVSVAPVTLGSGRPLLPRRLESDRLRLKSVRQAGQFAELVYSVTSRPDE